MDPQAEEEVRKKEWGREIEREEREEGESENKRLGGTWDGEGKLEALGCVCEKENQTAA